MAYYGLLENIFLKVRWVVCTCEIACLKGGIISEMIRRPQVLHLSSELVIVELSVIRFQIDCGSLAPKLLAPLQYSFLLLRVCLILILLNLMFVAPTKMGMEHGLLVACMLLLRWHTSIKGLAAM